MKPVDGMLHAVPGVGRALRAQLRVRDFPTAGAGAEVRWLPVGPRKGGGEEAKGRVGVWASGGWVFGGHRRGKLQFGASH